MEEMFEILPWLFGGTVVTAGVGAALGAKYLGPGGAVIGMVGGPIVSFWILLGGTMVLSGPLNWWEDRKWKKFRKEMREKYPNSKVNW